MKTRIIFLSVAALSMMVLGTKITLAQPSDAPKLPAQSGTAEKKSAQAPITKTLQETTGTKKGVKGIAFIEGTAEDSLLSGVVNFTETPEGLLIEADVFDVPDLGEHGFHIHEKGSCEDGGNAAGGHFNPTNAKHGMLTHDGSAAAHIGDMGNITIDQNGEGTLSMVLPEVGLKNGKYNVAGLAVILHEKKDDMGQPTGNAGGRIGCGVIELDEDEENLGEIMNAPEDLNPSTTVSNAEENTRPGK